MDIICLKTGHHFSSVEDARECAKNCVSKCPFEYLKYYNGSSSFSSNYKSPDKKLPLSRSSWDIINMAFKYRHTEHPPMHDTLNDVVSDNQDIKQTKSLPPIINNPPPPTTTQPTIPTRERAFPDNIPPHNHRRNNTNNILAIVISVIFIVVALFLLYKINNPS